jgi:hypothetical protein
MAIVQSGRLFAKQRGNELCARVQRRSGITQKLSAAVGLGAPSNDEQLLRFVRGRVHAKENVKEIEQWRDATIHEFLEQNKSPREHKPHRPQRIKLPPPTPEVVRSPDHFMRLYGPRRACIRHSPRTRLEPLRHSQSGSCGTIMEDGAAPPLGRAARNAETRAMVWRVARCLEGVQDAALERAVDDAAC